MCVDLGNVMYGRACAGEDRGAGFAEGTAWTGARDARARGATEKGGERKGRKNKSPSFHQLKGFYAGGGGGWVGARRVR